MRQRMEHVNLWLVVLLAFCLPLSTSAVSVLALLLCFGWAIDGRLHEKLYEIIASPICIAVLIYLGILLIGLGWSDSLADGWTAIRKQWKILLTPIVLTTVRWDDRGRVLGAFIAGIAVTALVITLDSLALLPEIEVASRRLVFHTETVQLFYTPMLAFALYLLGHRLLWGERQTSTWWAVLVLTVLLLVHLFLARGRAGHVAFFVLLALFVFQYYRRNLIRACACISILFPLFFIAAWQFSPMFQERVTAIRTDMQSFEQQPETSSVGLRLHYWDISWRIIKQSPWIGVGTGDFARAYGAMNSQVSPNIPATNNPHNQYVFAAAQLGLLGLLSLLGLVGVHFVQALRTDDGWQRIRVAFPAFFMTIMCFESYLNLSGTGCLFALFSALLFKRTSGSMIASQRS